MSFLFCTIRQGCLLKRFVLRQSRDQLLKAVWAFKLQLSFFGIAKKCIPFTRKPTWFISIHLAVVKVENPRSIAFVGRKTFLLNCVGQGSQGARAIKLKEHHRFIIDRKSTRLNSSHVKISYAVFCLKKKRN